VRLIVIFNRIPQLRIFLVQTGQDDSFVGDGEREEGKRIFETSVFYARQDEIGTETSLLEGVVDDNFITRSGDIDMIVLGRSG